MSTFINMNAVLKIKPDAKATCNKIICDTIIESYHSVEDMADGQSLDDFYKTADMKDLLSEDFDAEETNTNEYSIEFCDSCSYSFVEEIKDMFTKMAPYLENGSTLSIQYNDDDDDFIGFEIKNDKLINIRCHDFYTDDSNLPSKDDIANAILHAAEKIKANNMNLTELSQNLPHVLELLNS